MKQKAILMALLLSACLVTGCGDKKKDSTPDKSVSSTSSSESEPDTTSEYEDYEYPTEDQTYTDANGELYTVTVDGSILRHTADGIVWEYMSGMCRLTFPKEWSEQVIVRGTSVYCKACYDDQEGNGELFTLDFCSDSAITNGTKYAALIGGVRERNMYVVARTPDEVNYDESKEELDAAYKGMSSRLSAVFQSGICSSTPAFKPIDLSKYENVTEESTSQLFGSWKDLNQPTPPIAVFRSGDGAFGYRDDIIDPVFGNLLINKNAVNYVYNTEAWGDAGLLFAGGQVYRVTYYETEPMTLEFQPLFPSASENPFGKNIFTYVGEEEDIFTSGNTNFVEMPSAG